MYTKQELRELRDLLIDRKNKEAQTEHLFGNYFKPGWVTASYIYSTLLSYSEPSDFERYLLSMAQQAKNAPEDPQGTDFVLAYNLFFGDISAAPHHIHDSFELISAWRLKSPNAINSTQYPL